MTARELYETSAEFRSFISAWVYKKHCPLPLVDFLLDRDMVSQAECARWCAETGVRSPRFGKTGYHPYPTRYRDGTWVWYGNDNKEPFFYHHVPSQRVHTFGTIRSLSARLAIVKLLDLWRPE